MNEDLVTIFEIFITSHDKIIAEECFEFLVTHFTDQKKDTKYFKKLKDDFFHYKPWEIIGIHSALKVEFERLSGIRIH